MATKHNMVSKESERHEACASLVRNERGSTRRIQPTGASLPTDFSSIEPNLNAVHQAGATDDEITASTGSDTGIKIRTPKPEDICGIVAVVRACQPFLTPHMSYIYWMNIRCCRETCGVAERSGEIVGWCSIIPVSKRKYFLHQLGVAPSVRRTGLAQSLVAHLLNKLKRREATAFDLEFTIDQRNRAAFDLFCTIADNAGMLLLKRSEAVLLEEACSEELYAMTGLKSLV